MTHVAKSRPFRPRAMHVLVLGASALALSASGPLPAAAKRASPPVTQSSTAPASVAAPAADSDLIKAPTVAPRTPVPLFVPAEYPMPGAPAPGTYAMRCWQKGRLLFTESNLTEAVVSSIPNKVAAFTEKGARVDAGSATLYVVEVANSLCVIKRA
jgi:hypothetical protein